jgi:hypothetical protein
LSIVKADDKQEIAALWGEFDVATPFAAIS